MALAPDLTTLPSLLAKDVGTMERRLREEGLTQNFSGPLFRRSDYHEALVPAQCLDIHEYGSANSDGAIHLAGFKCFTRKGGWLVGAAVAAAAAAVVVGGILRCIATIPCLITLITYAALSQLAKSPATMVRSVALETDTSIISLAIMGQLIHKSGSIKSHRVRSRDLTNMGSAWAETSRYVSSFENKLYGVPQYVIQKQPYDETSCPSRRPLITQTLNNCIQLNNVLLQRLICPPVYDFTIEQGWRLVLNQNWRTKRSKVRIASAFNAGGSFIDSQEDSQT
ncbi:hypothetical protein M0804_011774 [Polistes exclamans]|nr:hypothetical protein M0804_011774 [Polistes exclamans]